jgi:hypothetical protein
MNVSYGQFNVRNMLLHALSQDHNCSLPMVPNAWHKLRFVFSHMAIRYYHPTKEDEGTPKAHPQVLCSLRAFAWSTPCSLYTEAKYIYKWTAGRSRSTAFTHVPWLLFIGLYHLHCFCKMAAKQIYSFAIQVNFKTSALIIIRSSGND